MHLSHNGYIGKRKSRNRDSSLTVLSILDADQMDMGEYDDRAVEEEVYHLSYSALWSAQPDIFVRLCDSNFPDVTRTLSCNFRCR
jgi:hypothetical protein